MKAQKYSLSKTSQSEKSFYIQEKGRTTSYNFTGNNQTFGTTIEILFIFLIKTAKSPITKLMVISLFLIPLSSSIYISEVESNPTGPDSGKEWIEFYSEEGTYSDYFVIELSNQWLDNSDEKIYLKKDNKTIDKTDLLEDSDNDGDTWFVCDGKWKYGKETKENENDCGEENREEEEDEEDEEPLEESEEESTAKTTAQTAQTSKQLKYKTPTHNNEPIILNAQTKPEAESFISKQEKTRIYIIFSFTLLTIFIIVLFSLRKL